MADVPLKVYSRISALEFILEVLVANELARMPEKDSAKFRADLSSRPASLPPRSGPMDAEVFQEMERQVTADLENFARKAATREREIREALAQLQ